MKRPLHILASLTVKFTVLSLASIALAVVLVLIYHAVILLIPAYEHATRITY
jgi:hypothetical protein